MSHQRRLWFLLRSRKSQEQVSRAHSLTLESSPEVSSSAADRATGHKTRSSGSRSVAGISHAYAPSFATMRAGSVLLFGPYAVHGSLPNTSPRPRRTFINGYAYPGANARVYPGAGAGRLLHCPEEFE